MRKLLSAILLTTISGMASAGSVEQAAAAAGLTTVKNIEVQQPAGPALVLSEEDSLWRQSVINTYTKEGLPGFKDLQLLQNTGLPGIPLNVGYLADEYRKICLDIAAGWGIPAAELPLTIESHRFTLDGKTGYFIHYRFAENVYLTLLDASGRIFAEGSTDAGVFTWRK